MTLSLVGIPKLKHYKGKHPVRIGTVGERARAYRQAIKAMVLTYYGNGNLSCVKCGESRIDCLSIDHINGGGTKQRAKASLRSSSAFYRWLIKENYPEGYQTLCMNCQFIKKHRDRP